MKRYFSIILSIVLFVSALPLNVFAIEDALSEHEELIELACEVFPEYSSKILGEIHSSNASNARSLSAPTREELFTETRKYGENSSLIYTEYSDGLVLITAVSDPESDGCEHDITYNERHTGAGATTVSMTVRATYNGASSYGYGCTGYFKISNFQYTTISGDYDYINSVGTATESGDISSLSSKYSYSMNETSSANAYVKHYLQLQIGTSAYHSLNSWLTITVGDDGASVTHKLVG